MDRDIVEKLKKFINAHSDTYCYGVGWYGEVVVKALRIMKLKILCGIVTKDLSSRINDLPIKLWQDVKSELNCNSGIILSLPEKYHDEVLQNVSECIENENILRITAEDIKVLGRYIYGDDFKKNSYQKLISEFTESKSKHRPTLDYCENFFKDFWEKYKTVELRYFAAAGGSEPGFSWIYWTNWRKKHGKDDIYYLFLPYLSYNKSNNIDWSKIGNYLLVSKYKLDNLEVIMPERLGLWQYGFEKYPDKFWVEKEWPYYGIINKFNKCLVNGEIDTHKKYVNLNNEELRIGDEYVKRLGANKWFCVFARDNAYYQNIYHHSDKQIELLSYRNSNIEDYELTAKYMKSLGISAFRMGAKVEKPVKQDSLIIDYAYNDRTELLDLYLFNKAEFFIGDISGIVQLYNLFSHPVIGVNSVALTHNTNDYLGFIDAMEVTDFGRDLMIFDKFFDKDKNRYLTFRDMLEYETQGYAPHMGNLYNELNIIIVKNTPEEIFEVAKEMVERLNGKAIYTEEDIELQNKFVEIKREYERKNNIFRPYRIGRDFLRKNKWLLD